MIGRLLRGVALALVWVVAVGCAAWAMGALYFDLNVLTSTK